MQTSTVKIFIAFAKEDRDVRDKLLRQMNLVKNREGWDIWASHEIKAGAVWNEEIKARLAGSEVVVLLMSSSFFNSNYIIDVELPAIVEKHRAGNCHIVPVLARHCLWKDTDFGGYAQLGDIQALPAGEKPIVSKGNWDSEEEAYMETVQGLKVAIKEFKDKLEKQAELERKALEEKRKQEEEEKRKRKEEALRAKQAAKEKIRLEQENKLKEEEILKAKQAADAEVQRQREEKYRLEQESKRKKEEALKAEQIADVEAQRQREAKRRLEQEGKREKEEGIKQVDLKRDDNIMALAMAFWGFIIILIHYGIRISYYSYITPFGYWKTILGLSFASTMASGIILRLALLLTRINKKAVFGGGILIFLLVITLLYGLYKPIYTYYAFDYGFLKLAEKNITPVGIKSSSDSLTQSPTVDSIKYYNLLKEKEPVSNLNESRESFSYQDSLIYNLSGTAYNKTTKERAKIFFKIFRSKLGDFRCEGNFDQKTLFGKFKCNTSKKTKSGFNFKGVIELGDDGSGFKPNTKTVFWLTLNLSKESLRDSYKVEGTYIIDKIPNSSWSDRKQEGVIK